MKTVEKFGKTIELLLERNPEKQEEEEEKEKEETEPSDLPPAEENNTLMNKTARKRPLFSQTCNTLLGTLLSKIFTQKHWRCGRSRALLQGQNLKLVNRGLFSYALYST